MAGTLRAARWRAASGNDVDGKGDDVHRRRLVAARYRDESTVSTAPAAARLESTRTRDAHFSGEGSVTRFT